MREESESARPVKRLARHGRVAEVVAVEPDGASLVGVKLDGGFQKITVAESGILIDCFWGRWV